MSRKVDGQTIREGFVVTPTLNGGWLLTNIPGQGYVPVNRGAFTNDDDLIGFIIAELKPESRIVADSGGSEFFADPEIIAMLAGNGGGSSDGE